MSKYKRLIATLLVGILGLSSMLSLTPAIHASEIDGIYTEQVMSKEKRDDLDMVEENGDGLSLSIDDCVKQVGYEKMNADWSEALAQEVGNQYVEDVGQDILDDSVVEESALNESLNSLFALPEIRASLNLKSLGDVDITKVPAGLVVGMLQNKNGEYLVAVVDELGKVDGDRFYEFLENHAVVWSYFKEKDNERIQDEYHVMQWDDELDLSPIIDDARQYKLELIIGSGKQLDENAKRYIVTVYVTEEVIDVLTFDFYTQDDDGMRHRVDSAYSTKTSQDVYNQLYQVSLSAFGVQSPDELTDDIRTQFDEMVRRLPKTVEVHWYKVPDQFDGKEYYFNINSQLDNHPNVEVSVYEYLEYASSYLNFGTGRTITDQILNQDMNVIDGGYKTTFNVPQNTGDGTIDTDNFKNSFVVVYTSGGIVQNVVIETIVIADDYSRFDIEAFKNENGKMSGIIHDEVRREVVHDVKEKDIFYIKSTDILYTTIIDVILKEDYPANEEYYFSLNAYNTNWDNANAHVVKAVEGLCMDLESASNLPDIKEQLIPYDRSGQYGYKTNYYFNKNGDGKHCVYFTVFFDDNTFYNFAVAFHDYSELLDPETYMDYDSAPVVGSVDPWFRITGLKQDDRVLDTYVIENGKAMNMDTRYGYGYQAILINDENVDLTRLKPVFWPEESISNYKIVTTGEEEVSGQTEHDFTQPI